MSTKFWSTLIQEALKKSYKGNTFFRINKDTVDELSEIFTTPIREYCPALLENKVALIRFLDLLWFSILYRPKTEDFNLVIYDKVHTQKNIVVPVVPGTYLVHKDTWARINGLMEDEVDEYTTRNWIPISSGVNKPNELLNILTTTPLFMIIAKYPGYEEKAEHQSFVGHIAQDLLDSCRQAIGEEFQVVYATNYCKLGLPVQSDALAAQVGKDFYRILQEEILAVRPDALLVIPIGRLKESLKKWLAYNPQNGTGIIPAANEHDDKQIPITFVPFSFNSIIRNEIRLLGNRLRAIRNPEKQCEATALEPEYEVIRTPEHLQEILEKNAAQKYVGLDCEWEGRHPINSNAFLRTIQMSFNERKAFIIEPEDKSWNNWKPFGQLLNEFLNTNDRIIIGSFFYTDFIWLKWIGVDLTNKYKEPFQILDVAMATRAIDEDAELDLCKIVQRFRPEIPRWDNDLNSYCKQHKIEMYGTIPAEILHPYGAKDVTYLFLIKDDLEKQLKQDPIAGVDCTPAYHMLLKACAVLTEMMDTGILLDIDKFNTLKEKFQTTYQRMLTELRKDINWPDFDPQKPKHRLEFLFGDKYVTGGQCRPSNAMALNLTPVFSTTKKAARWEELDSQVQSFSRPSTDKTCCGILSGKHPYAKRLYQLTIINQVLKTVFGKNSLLHYCNADGRIRTFLSPTLKTGRFSSSKPNLQNLSKRRDEEYSELIGEPIKLRSMLVPSPGHAIIMADLVSAELLALAIMSGDEVLLDHCRRSALPETDSNHYDIHSNLAVRAFNLDCEPTKKGLKSIGKLHLRTAAKAIIYGCNYGRSLETIKTEIESQGLSVTLEEVARLKDTMYQMYPKTATLLQSLMEAPYHRKFIRTYHGRCKRFTTATNKIVLSAQSRESANFPFQATVADIMTLWMYNLWLHPQKAVLQYKLLLPIHDELWVEVPEANVEPTINLMQNLILELKLPSWSLDGSPLSDAIYHFDIDTTVVKNS